MQNRSLVIAIPQSRVNIVGNDNVPICKNEIRILLWGDQFRAYCATREVDPNLGNMVIVVTATTRLWVCEMRKRYPPERKKSATDVFTSYISAGNISLYSPCGREIKI
jgi:hypothetical protein